MTGKNGKNEYENTSEKNKCKVPVYFYLEIDPFKLSKYDNRLGNFVSGTFLSKIKKPPEVRYC